MATGYTIPQEAIYCEQEIKKSRFLIFAEPVASPAEAKSRLKQIKEDHPDARHHCYAYMCGKPGQTTLLGSSDDGEPSGTAGAPILNVLQHKNISDLLIVVVRYFGGIKLGTGGLVRAYSSSAQLALENLPTTTKVEWASCHIHISYSLEPSLRHFLDLKDISILKTQYSNSVEIYLQVPKEKLSSLQKELIEYSNNQIQFVN